MNNIQKYFAGREHVIELLQAVGIRTLEQFASADPSTVLPELHQAKRMLKLQTEIPSAPVFREWVNQALSSPIAPEPELLPIHEGDGLPLATPVDPPITDSSEEVTINKLRYAVEYQNGEGASTNAATNGQTVTVTNRSRTKILPSTGGYGSLLYRISGAMLVLASLIVLININKKNHLNEKSKNRRKK